METIFDNDSAVAISVRNLPSFELCDTVCHKYQPFGLFLVIHRVVPIAQAMSGYI